jgi:hypothetical protein
MRISLPVVPSHPNSTAVAVAVAVAVVAAAILTQHSTSAAVAGVNQAAGSLSDR